MNAREKLFPFHPRPRRLALLLAAAIALAGCQPSDPLARKVTAASPIDYATWRSSAAEKFPAATCRDFDDIVQEMKFNVMANQQASGSTGIDDATRAKLHGRTVREILTAGYQLKIARLESERAELATFITGNASMRTRPGDTASSDFLADKVKRQSRQLDTIVTQLNLTREKQARLLGLAYSATVAGQPAAPAAPQKFPAEKLEPPDTGPILLRKK